MGLSTAEERESFAKRLRRACDRNPNIPPERMGRQAAIATTLGVVPEAVSRWFAGETMPSNARMRDLAKLLGVDVGWLTLGFGDESPMVRNVASRRMSASTMIVRGLLSMHGLTVVDVPESDPGFDAISFYIVIDGQLVPIIVVSATPIDKGEYETIVPSNFEVGHVIAVLPKGMTPVLLQLTSTTIRRNKRSSTSGLALTIREAGSGIYRVGSKSIPRIRNFAVLTVPEVA